MGSRKRSSFPRKETFIGWLLVLLALPLGFFTFTMCMDKLASTSWPAAQAEVSTIDIRKRVKSGAWCIELRYHYRVGDHRFSSTRLSLTTKVACYRDKQVANALFRRFQPGAGIAIRYDPSDPETSIVYLDDVDFSDFIFLILTAAFLGAGIILIKGTARK
ncbi:DUF3592 domain-containing protein [Massilia alkalitolerans]|uniref:DUF3592 domain-containing protein n=1 Tax=Massilia alkalitolerans TaxID=286638 RepID=UPI0028B0436F|nr:DUF3592 domain-containing protein [Massilia alkalitolerans]